ncbi:MAG: helix-turn-helix domain-containing protein [Phycisphaerales bacterium]
MAKLFYTVDEAAQKLRKSKEQILDMVKSGQLQEIRHKDELVFKVEAIDLLAGGEEELEIGELKLSDSVAGAGGSSMNLGDDKDAGITLAESGAGMPAMPARPAGKAPSRPADPGDTGITLMDSGAPAAKGGKSASAFDSMGSVAGSSVRPGQGEKVDLENVGSGSGILDLTRESDDTTLGAELLDQAFSNEDNPEPLPNASGLFDRPDAESGGNLVGAAATAGITPMPLGTYMESYDGAWSGVAVAGMVAATVGLIAMGLVVLLTIGGGSSPLARTFSESWMYWTGGFALVTAVLMVIGFFVGKATE